MLTPAGVAAQMSGPSTKTWTDVVVGQRRMDLVEMPASHAVAVERIHAPVGAEVLPRRAQGQRGDLSSSSSGRQFPARSTTKAPCAVPPQIRSPSEASAVTSLFGSGDWPAAKVRHVELERSSTLSPWSVPTQTSFPRTATARTGAAHRPPAAGLPASALAEAVVEEQAGRRAEPHPFGRVGDRQEQAAGVAETLANGRRR